MQLKNPFVMFDGKSLGTLKAVTLNPIGRCFDVKFDGKTVKCHVNYDEPEWAKLMKLLARVVRIQVNKPIPGVKKGETVTIHSPFEGRDITGKLYHVRKPRRDSEARIYYIREDLGQLKKSAGTSVGFNPVAA